MKENMPRPAALPINAPHVSVVALWRYARKHISLIPMDAQHLLTCEDCLGMVALGRSQRTFPIFQKTLLSLIGSLT
jgi:hypothetical protein